MDTHTDAADAETTGCGCLPLDDADDCMMQYEYAGCYPWLADFIGAHPHAPMLRTARSTGNDDMDAWGY